MSLRKDGFAEVYNKVVDWIEDVKQHEMTDIVELVEQVKAYAKAAEAIPEEKVKQFVDNFEHDLKDFYHQNQSDMKHSVYLGVLNEAFWEKLAQMTDRSKVEWAELVEDFQHQGKYQSGDFIGFGVLECIKCHHKVEVSHYSEVIDCSECGGQEFTRLPLSP
mgnify:FL=1